MNIVGDKDIISFVPYFSLDNYMILWYDTENNKGVMPMDNTKRIKAIEPILGIQAEKEYAKQKQDFMFQKYFKEELYKRKRPITVFGHIEVDI